MEAEKAVQEKQAELERAQLETNIGLEEERQKLVALAARNARSESDTRAYGISTTMQALASADPQVLQALATAGMKPQQLIAFAFQELAAKAEKIGNLNISPELLSELLDRPSPRK
ncbi:MAG: hypothetical protein IT576_21205 [Verrucomicrobiales bacterium]|nr:hypothetical protein [Verrucomicrobiales bacterium]